MRGVLLAGSVERAMNGVSESANAVTAATHIQTPDASVADRLRERFFVFQWPPAAVPEPSGTVLAAGLEGAGRGRGIFSTTYVPSGPHTATD